MRVFRLPANSLEKLPHQICCWPSLSPVYPRNTRLFTVPGSFTRLTSVRILDLSENCFDEIPKGTCTMKNLEVLALDGSQMQRYLLLCFHFYFIDTLLLQNLISSLQLSPFPTTVRRHVPPGVHLSLGYSLSLTSEYSDRKSKNMKTSTFVLDHKDKTLTGGIASVFCIFFWCMLEKSCICIESVSQTETEQRATKNGCDIVNAFKIINVCCSFDNKQFCTLKLYCPKCNSIHRTYSRAQNTSSFSYNVTLPRCSLVQFSSGRINLQK